MAARTRVDHVVDQDDDAVVHGGGHLRRTQQRPLSRGREVVAVERGIENADDRLHVRDLPQIECELARQGNAAVGNGDQVEPLRILAALEDLVGDTHQGPANAGLVEDGPGAIARLTAARGSPLIRLGMTQDRAFLRLTERN
jgi:hypothetical protein